MADSERHEWVTVREAAELLGKSGRTIWRYVADGRLTVDRDMSPVLVDIWRELQDTPSGRPRDTVGALKAEIIRLTAEVDKVTALNDILQRERDELLKEVELFIRAIHADPYSDFEPDKIQELFTAIVERFDDGMDALAIVAKLPQCWQFNDDKTALVQECPVVPGMVVWWAIGDIPWTGVVRATFCNYLLAFTEDGLKWSKESTLVHSDCFDSAAAAEFATQQAMKE